MATPAGDNTLNISVMTSVQLSDALRQLNADFGPITPSTRGVYERKLVKLRLENVRRAWTDDTGNVSSDSSPTRSTRTTSSMPTVSETTARSLLTDDQKSGGMLRKPEHAASCHGSAEELSMFVEDDNNISYNFNVSSMETQEDAFGRGVKISSTAASSKSVTGSIKLSSLGNGAVETTLKDKIPPESSARRNVSDKIEHFPGEKQLNQVENSSKILDDVLKIQRDVNHTRKSGIDTKTGEDLDEGFLRYRGSDDSEGRRFRTNESGAWKYERENVAENLAKERNGNAGAERERFGTEHYDSLSRSFYSGSLTRPSLESLTRPPLHPELKKKYATDSEDDDFTVLSEHDLRKAVDEANREPAATSIPLVPIGLKYFFKVMIPIAIILFIVFVFSVVEPEFLNPVVVPNSRN